MCQGLARSHGAGPRPPPRIQSVGRRPPEPHGSSAAPQRTSPGSSGAGPIQGAWRGAAQLVPVWQARPVQPGGQAHLPGKVQLPPFWHGAQQRAARQNMGTASAGSSGGPELPPLPPWVHVDTHTVHTHTQQNTHQHQPRARMLCPSPGAMGLS